MKARFHRQNGNMAEFAPAFCILIAALFPLIDLLGLAMSVGTAHFINSQAAQKAAVAGTPANAVDVMFDELDNFSQSNFSKFANLKILMPSRPSPGDSTGSSNGGDSVGSSIGGSIGAIDSKSLSPNSSTMLYVIRTNIINSANGTEHTLAPPPDQFDPNTYIYEYYVLTTFQINPFINLKAIPGLSAIPGLGQPYNLKITSARAIESTEPFDINQGPTWGMNGEHVNSWRPGLPR